MCYGCDPPGSYVRAPPGPKTGPFFGHAFHVVKRRNTKKTKMRRRFWAQKTVTILRPENVEMWTPETTDRAPLEPTFSPTVDKSGGCPRALSTLPPSDSAHTFLSTIKWPQPQRNVNLWSSRHASDHKPPREAFSLHGNFKEVNSFHNIHDNLENKSE